MKTLQDYIDKLNALNFKDMYNSDFFLTWEKQTTNWKQYLHWQTHSVYERKQHLHKSI